MSCRCARRPASARAWRRVGFNRQCALLLVAFSFAVSAAPAKTIEELINDANKNKQGLGEGGGDAGSGAQAGCGDSDALCVTQEGAFLCTGRFGGVYDLSCEVTGSKGVKDYGVGTLTFRSDDSIELCLQSKSPVWGRTPSTGPGSPADPIRGRVESSGHILIERNEEGVALRWEGQFSLASTPDGQRPVGGGKYQSKGVFLGGDVVQTCQGTFTLGEGGSTP